MMLIMIAITELRGGRAGAGDLRALLEETAMARKHWHRIDILKRNCKLCAGSVFLFAQIGISASGAGHALQERDHMIDLWRQIYWYLGRSTMLVEETSHIIERSKALGREALRAQRYAGERVFAGLRNITKHIILSMWPSRFYLHAAEAAKFLTTAIALEPGDATLYILRSVTESRRCHHNAAIADAQAAVKIDLNNPDGYLRSSIIRCRTLKSSSGISWSDWDQVLT